MCKGSSSGPDVRPRFQARILSQVFANTLIGLLKSWLARELQVVGKGKKGEPIMDRASIHPAVIVATLVLLALAFAGAVTASGTLP
jgi:hypothetical protein